LRPRLDAEGRARVAGTTEAAEATVRRSWSWQIAYYRCPKGVWNFAAKRTTRLPTHVPSFAFWRHAANGDDASNALRRIRCGNMLERSVETKAANRLPTILLVDDQDASRIATKWFLNNFGFEVDSARNAEEALALFDFQIHDLVITDNSMPAMSGAELAHIIKLRSPSTPVVMFSGSIPADRSCLDRVIQKPAHLLAVKDAAEELLAARHSA